MITRKTIIFGTVLAVLLHSPITIAEEEMNIVEEDADYEVMVMDDEALEAEQKEAIAEDIAKKEKHMGMSAEGINYVPMPNPAQPKKVLLSVEGADNLRSQLRGIAGKMKEFTERMSRGKVVVTTEIGPIRTGRPPKIAGVDRKRLVLIPGRHSSVPVIGNAITAKHELFHQFSLGHANVRIWATQLKEKQYGGSKDPFCVMTNTPGQISLNAAHIHKLGWFSETEEAYAEPGKEYVLRLINDGNRDYKSLKSLFYQVPGASRQIFFSYVNLGGKKGWNVPKGMPGTAIAIHELAGSSYLTGLIGLEPKTEIRSGLILELSEATSKTVKVKVSLDPNWKLELPPAK